MRVSATIFDKETENYLIEQKKRYGSYAAFLRALIIQSQSGTFLRETTTYTRVVTKELVKREPLPYISELKQAIEKRKKVLGEK